MLLCRSLLATSSARARSLVPPYPERLSIACSGKSGRTMAAHIRHCARKKRNEIVFMVENQQPDSPGARLPAAVFEYSRPAFHAIQEMVLDGYRKEGGEEKAAVLYGTRERNIVRVQVARRIACEHERGRTLLLSANDTAALKEQLTREATEPALQGLAVVGWFLSHTAPIRTAMTASGRTELSSADLKTFNDHFGAPGQITLVLRPHVSATMQASVFVRRADRSVNAKESDLDFPFTEREAFPDSPKGLESNCPHPSAPAVRETALAAAAATNATTVSVPTPTAAALAPAEPAAPARENASTSASPKQARIPKPEPAVDPPASAKPAALVTPTVPLATADGREALPVTRIASLPDLKPYPSFGSYSDPDPRLTFEFAKLFAGLWGIVGLFFLAGVASMPFGIKYYRSLPESVPISLSISEHNSQIQVRWNHSSRVIREATQGSIEILDGKQSRSAALSADDLSHGDVIYMRQTGEVQIRLKVENAKGQKTQEATHFIEPNPFVGRNHTPVTADAAEALRNETKAPPGEQTAAARKASDEKTRVEPVQRTKSGPLHTERAKGEPAKSEAPKSKQTAQESSSRGPSGIYLQLAATSKLEAEIMVDGLRQKRFESLAAEIPGKAGTYRVLVGPVRDGSVNKLRADLQDAGFPGNGAIRRTF